MLVFLGIGLALSVMEVRDTLGDKEPRRILPTVVLTPMPNAPTATISIELSARGDIRAPVSTCASGAEAIAYDANLIALERAGVVVAEGTDVTLHPMTVATFAVMRALSTRNADPRTTSRPFAPNRDGFVLGEGAGPLVLERATHTRARGARILTVLAGSGATIDAYGVTRLEPSGAEQERVLWLALERMGLDPGCVEHISAHATSTPTGDVVGTSVLTRMVPDATVSATRSVTGRPLGGVGGLETVLTVVALQAHRAPPILLPAGVNPELAQLNLDVVEPQGQDLP